MTGLTHRPPRIRRVFVPLATLLLLAGLAACKPKQPETTTAADAAATPGAPIKTSAADSAQAKAAEEQVAQLLNDAGPAPVEGSDYALIASGQPFQPETGKIEVAEVFNHVCPACASFQPLVSAWKAKLPADVHFVNVPAQFGGPFDLYARAFYAAEALGVEQKSHEALYRAIHIDHTLKGESGRDTPQDVARFYQGYGVDPARFVETMGSFAMEGKLAKARQFVQRSGIEGTPTLIVAGKYRVTGPEKATRADQLRIANQLIARERAAAGGSAPAPQATPAAGAPASAGAPGGS